MRYPKSLKEGGTIGFIAPSFGCAIEPYKTRFENAIKVFTEMGYKVWLGPNCYEGSGVGISNTPQLCGDELNSAMSGDDRERSDVIITCGGGELMCEVVPFIDFERIAKSEPKWYMGYSDNTNFTFLSATLADTAAIYGPCAPAFGRTPWHSSIDDALKLLKGETFEVGGYELWEKNEDSDDESEADFTAPYNVTEKKEIVYYLPEQKKAEKGLAANMKGRLLGGCIDILTLLCGTKYDKVSDFIEKYREDGIIWFLESCDLDMLSLRRAFWQMREAGWFDNSKGFLIGRPLHFGEDCFGVNQYNAVTDIIGELGVPIIMDLDIGHLPPMMPLVCGSMAEVKVSGNDIKIKYDFN